MEEPPGKRPRLPPRAYRFGFLPPDVFEKLADELYYTHGSGALDSFLEKVSDDPLSDLRGVYHCAKLANRLKMRTRTVDPTEPIADLRSVAGCVRHRLQQAQPDYCSMCGAWSRDQRGLERTPKALRESGVAAGIVACRRCWQERYSMEWIAGHSDGCPGDGFKPERNAIQLKCDMCLVEAFQPGYVPRLYHPGGLDRARRTCDAVGKLIRTDFFPGQMLAGPAVPEHWKPDALAWADKQDGATERDIQESFIRHFLFLSGGRTEEYPRLRAEIAEKRWRSRLN